MTSHNTSEFILTRITLVMALVAALEVRRGRRFAQDITCERTTVYVLAFLLLDFRRQFSVP